MCKKCGLPAEIAHEGSKAVARWRKHPTVTSVDAVTGLVVVQEDRRLSKRQRKAARKTVHSLGRKRNKHGRQHA